MDGFSRMQPMSSKMNGPLKLLLNAAATATTITMAIVQRFRSRWPVEGGVIGTSWYLLCSHLSGRRRSGENVLQHRVSLHALSLRLEVQEHPVAHRRLIDLADVLDAHVVAAVQRSEEERRVGKECRSRWS